MGARKNVGFVGILRHGLAGERDPARYPDDDLRPLTSACVKRTRDVARGLAAMQLGFEQIWTSPLTRARQTAEIAAKILGIPRRGLVEHEELRPEASPATLGRKLNRLANEHRVLLVGHEPHLSQFISWLCAGSATRLQLTLKKAGFSGVELPSRFGRGRGSLLFLLTPAQVIAQSSLISLDG